MMRFKCTILLLMVVWTISFAQQKSNMVTLSGTLKGFNNQVDIEDLSEFQYLLPPTSERMLIPDGANTFKISFSVKSPNYFRLGRNILYLSPGDQMEVYIDKNDPRNSTFKGKGAEANLYLRNTPFPKGGSFLEAGKLVKDTPEGTIKGVEEAALVRTKELARATGISEEFRRLETARIKADLINSLLSGQSYSEMILKLKGEEAKVYGSRYHQAIQPKVELYGKNFIDPGLMKLVVYRDIANDLPDSKLKNVKAEKVNEWYTASELVNKMQRTGDKKELAKFKGEIQLLKTIAYRDAASKMLKQLLAFGEGDMAVDFTAVDLNGNQVTLSSLKGKVIYVDLWATWCGPCMKEMPHFEKLKVKYKDNPNVVFVSLSLDDTDVVWKKSIAERKADGYQWIINRAKLQDYNIVGIPRILLIDKQFKMVGMDAPAPSSAAAVKAIDLLL